MKRLMLLIISVGIIIATIATVWAFHDQEKLSPADYNVKRAEQLVDDIFVFVAYVEGDKGIDKPYYCGARWTQQYGITIKPNGCLIKKNDKPISNAKAKEWAVCHISKRVIPFFKYFDKRKMTDEEIYMTAMFMYNIGGETVTGKNLDGTIAGSPSRFFTEMNAGKDVEDCIDYMTGYRRSGGKRANGLLKRHWVAGAIGLGIINTQNVLELRPTQFYNTKNFGNYYFLNKKRQMIEKNGYYRLRYDDITINAFFNMNEAKNSQKSVRDILP